MVECVIVVLCVVLEIALVNRLFRENSKIVGLI